MSFCVLVYTYRIYPTCTFEWALLGGSGAFSHIVTPIIPLINPLAQSPDPKPATLNPKHSRGPTWVSGFGNAA